MRKDASRLISASGDIMLDTNIVIASWKSDASVLTKLHGRTLATCSTIVGELYFGAYRSNQLTANVQRVANYIAANRMLYCDADTVRTYGQVKQRLLAKGRPIPDNDIWIAAIALQHSLTLITRDHHFSEVEGLIIEAW